ncbi:MAG: hypothetical protein AAF899_18095 [Pseudomonadota bacterium]
MKRYDPKVMEAGKHANSVIQTALLLSTVQAMIFHLQFWIWDAAPNTAFEFLVFFFVVPICSIFLLIMHLFIFLESKAFFRVILQLFFFKDWKIYQISSVLAAWSTLLWLSFSIFVMVVTQEFFYEDASG